MTKVCSKHQAKPAIIYGQCIGCEVERLREVERLARAFANAKGRHHSQQAMCDLLAHFGKPCVRPGDDPEMVTCACGDMYPPDSYGAGFMDANGDVCENCAAAEDKT